MNRSLETKRGGKSRRAATPATTRCVSEDLAALGGALPRGAGLGEALAVAGVLALAGVAGALAGALALAGVGAAAFHTLRMSGGDEGAGSEDRRGGRDQLALGHEQSPEYASDGLAPCCSPDRAATLRC